jgi:hypothetical protein
MKKICNQLQTGHSAFFKKKSDANKCSRLQENKVKVKKTVHTIRGKGWLVQA